MSDEQRPRRASDWEPGTLDHTRKNIGQIDPDEAKEMAKVLGGEVLQERSAPIHTTQQSTAGRIVRNTDSAAKGSASGMANMPQHKAYKRGQEDMPIISSRDNTMIDKLMMSSEYGIKQNYGLFNFIRKFQKNGTERVIPEFCTVTMKLHIENIEDFITVIKTLIQIAPNTYKAKIVNNPEAKFKFLRMVAGWTMQNIRLAYIDLQDVNPPILVEDLIPIIRAIYKPLMSIYYYGDTKIPKLIKEIYADQAAYPDAQRAKLSDLAKQAITQWIYLDTEIIKKLYPLLMRMCSENYEDYPAFFNTKVADILRFTGLHKFDLLLPEKPKEDTAKAKKQTPTADVKGRKDAVVDTGLSLLDQLFPQAGFKKLDTHPDLYPYFQPLYKFADGFNMLSPENPLQVTVVLVRLIEDCFQGCRNIKFTQPAEPEKPGADSVAQVLEDWSAYRETVFDQLYGEPLRNLVNQIYTQDDYEKTQFGKKLLTSLLWQTTYHFLPNFKFEQLLLERPADESKYRPLFQRTDYIRKYFTEVVAECDVNAKTRGTVSNLGNPWEHYKFSIPNEISKRLDVLLGGANTAANTNATNANLLKYTLCIVAVLDWWLNNPDSPAYATPPMHIYRISDTDGKPQFSIPERSDQNKLFADEIKAAYQRKAAQ